MPLSLHGQSSLCTMLIIRSWPMAFAARRSCRLGTGIVAPRACAPRRVFVSHDVSCDSKRKPCTTPVFAQVIEPELPADGADVRDQRCGPGPRLR